MTAIVGTYRLTLVALSLAIAILAMGLRIWSTRAGIDRTVRSAVTYASRDLGGQAFLVPSRTA